MIKKIFIKQFSCLALLLLVGACSTAEKYQLDLMPAPGFIKDFFTSTNEKVIPGSGSVRKILYATDRLPALENSEQDYYENKRGFVVRLGEASVSLGNGELSWEEARKLSLLKERASDFPLQVSAVEEMGVLDDTLISWMNSGEHAIQATEPRLKFTKRINEQLKISDKKDIYIYVHGFKVIFDNPMLVTAELWHFLGYQGVPIAYSWPATPERLAYASDIETAISSAHNFRLFLEYLARDTDAERIHIIGYSAGTRLVITALDQLALKHSGKTKTEIQKELKIGNTLIVASDFDNQVFAGYVLDGLLKVPSKLTLYASTNDSALGLSKWLFRRNRLGQIEDNLSKEAIEFLWHYDEEFDAIDVSNAVSSDSGNGHQYFRQSPWVSSDILVTLLHDLQPEERGLTRTEDNPVWRFSKDYIITLQDTLQALEQEQDKVLALPEK